MSMKYLGEQLDIHVGGEDLKSTHHPNEIAQSEAVMGKKPFCKYWIHGAFLLVDGGRMGKSEGNAYTIADIESRGYSPLALRYFFLTGNYRKQINFTWEALDGARTALDKLRHLVESWGEDGEKTQDNRGMEGYRKKFREAIEDDLNLPEALAVVWELVKSDCPDGVKKASLLKFDEVLGLNLSAVGSRLRRGRESSAKPGQLAVSDDIRKLLTQREALRKQKRFFEADKIREEIEKLGYRVGDDKLEG